MSSNILHHWWLLSAKWRGGSSISGRNWADCHSKSIVALFVCSIRMFCSSCWDRCFVGRVYKVGFLIGFPDFVNPFDIKQESEREGLLVTLWLTESSAYQTWQSIMVSHTAVDQLISWDSSINMSPPNQHMDLDILHVKNFLGVRYPDPYADLEDSCWLMSLNC